MTEPVLALSLLVRDEASLVRPHISFHRKMGVDAFVVTDNGSTDGTRELLSELARDEPIIVLDEPGHALEQDRWVNRMADIAGREFDADWIVNSDADEFWFANSGSLKSEIRPGIGGLSCPRHNMLGDRRTLDADGYGFHHQVLRVVRPRTDDQQPFIDPYSGRATYPFGLRKVRPKVMCRLAGLRWIGFGNHEAEHDDPMAKSRDIEVYHYPIRSYREFERKVVNHGTSLERNASIPENLGWHQRRWYDLYRRGQLDVEYASLIPDEAEATQWVQQGVLEIDATLCRIIEPIHGNEAPVAAPSSGPDIP